MSDTTTTINQETRTVRIPAMAQHEGFYTITVTLPWNCIFCGEKRGEPYKTLSYDGSRRLEVHGWRNPCGHVETYQDIREWVTAQQNDEDHHD